MATMERDILNLYQANDVNKLIQLLDKISDSEVAALISNRASRGRGEVLTLVQALMLASPSDSDIGLLRRLLVFKQCVSLLQANSLSSKVASELVGFLLLEVDCFPSKFLAELADLYVEAIKNGINSDGKALELFAKLMSALDVRPSVNHRGDEMSGSEFKGHLLNAVCACRWQPEQLLHLVTMFRDIPLSEEQLRFVLTKALRLLVDVEVQELPPLVYQLVALAAKGHKRLVLEGLSDFFTKRDKQLKIRNQNIVLPDVVTATDELKHVEGTAVLHVAFAAKQDQDLAREIIKYLKACSSSSSSQVLAPFNVAIALSIARIHRFEDQVFDLLKSSILVSFRDSKRRADSCWVRQTVPVDADDRTLLLLETVTNSIVGCDHVMQGLVQLGFLLMDAFGPKAVFGKITDDSPTPVANRSPGQRACDLGALILFNTFKTHELVRKEIIEQILNRVVTKATAPVSHYISLLSRTVMSSPQILLDSLPKLREAFDYLSLLPLVTADGLLQAMRPLLKISASLRDPLILVLKKAIFSRQLESRRTAVSGFLMMLRSFKVLGGIACSQPSQSISLSQVTVDIHRPYNPASNEALCLEIIGNLRRCLTQQAEVRLTLYQGLYEVLCCNSQLSNPVLGLLLLQFKKYYLSDEQTNPPLCLDACVTVQGSDVFLAEPLAHLIACISLCILKMNHITSDEDADESSVHTELDAILTSLTRRMTKCEPEDFELDKAADFSQTSTVGVRNTIYTLLIGNIYEALFEYNLSRLDDEQSIYEEAELLFRSHIRITDMLKDKAGGGAGNKKKGGGRGASGKGKSMLSLRFLASLLQRLFSYDNPHVDVLRQNSDLVRYVVTTALQKIQVIADRGRCDGADGADAEKVLAHLTITARAMLSAYRRKADSRPLSMQLLEGFVAINNVVCTRYSDKLASFLSELGTAVDEEDTMEDMADESSRLLQLHLKLFQRLVVTAMASDEEDHQMREVSLLLSVITAWCKQLSPEGAAMADALSWVHRLCTEQTPDDVGVTKTMLSLLIQLTSQQKNCALLLRDLARDLHTRLGDIDQDVEMDDDGVFSVITTRTAAPPVLQLVLSQLDRELNDCDWVVSRLKCAIDGQTDAETDTQTNAGVSNSAVERSVCTELAHCINAMHELTQTAVASGACAESLLHTLSRLYNSLTHLTKYFVCLYQQKSGHLPSRYEKLVKLSGTNLTQYVYATITYIQACQSETAQADGDRAKRKKRTDSQGKARAMKETRSIPNLIFAIEQYERYLIQLSKKSKINLMEHFKLSTSRDFRINAASLQAALEPEESDDERDDADDAEAGVNADEAGVTQVEATSSGKRQLLTKKKTAKKRVA